MTTENNSTSQITNKSLPSNGVRHNNDEKDCKKKSFLSIFESREIWSELTTSEILIRATSEVFGTALLVLVLCMGCLGGWNSGAPPSVQYSLSIGFVVLFVVQIFGHVSGAHVNPSITIAALIYQIISLPMAAIYIASQMLGATLGYGLLVVITPNEAYANDTAFCTTAPHPSVSLGQAVIVEALITGILCLLACSIWDGRNKTNTDAVSIKFGLTVATMAMSAGSYTGASMNPARSFAPALWTGGWAHQWVYWVGPILGACIFPLFYCLVFKTDAAPKKEIEEEPLREIHNKSAEPNV